MSLFKRKVKTISEPKFVAVPPRNGTLYVETSWANGYGWTNHLKVVNGTTYGERFTEWATKRYPMDTRYLQFQCSINHDSREDAVAHGCKMMASAKQWMAARTPFGTDILQPTITYEGACD